MHPVCISSKIATQLFKRIHKMVQQHICRVLPEMLRDALGNFFRNKRIRKISKDLTKLEGRRGRILTFWITLKAY